MSKQLSVCRGGGRVFIGTREERWSLSDPAHPLVEQGRHEARYPRTPASRAAALAVASVADDMHYLVYDCPTTKLACAKLAAMRAAVRHLGPIESKDGT